MKSETFPYLGTGDNGQAWHCLDCAENTNGVPLGGRRLSELWTFYSNFCLACQRSLEHRHTWPPQRISLWLTMGLRGDQPIRMAGMSDVPVLPVAIRRRGLR